VYVADSFAFYSPQWNEQRARDSALYARAPFDPALVRVLLRHGATRLVALDYLSGFSKINNPDRFAPDVHADEGNRFTRTYRPVRQIDQQRMEYLYPRQVDPALVARYFDEFGALLGLARSRGLRVTVVRPPLPERVLALLPGEAAFDARLREVVARHGGEIHDFSRVANADQYFYDTDHLNREGVLNFFTHHLAPLLKRAEQETAPSPAAASRGTAGLSSGGTLQ
jgi:hypothetical protein